MGLYPVRLIYGITTIHDLFKIHFISRIFNWSSIPDPRSSILDPSFPVNLEVLLIKIVLFFFQPLK